MNKYQEALEYLTNRAFQLNTKDYGQDVTLMTLSEKSIKAKKVLDWVQENDTLLQELVDRATPKKPIKKTFEYESMNEEILIKTYHICGCEKFSEVHHVDRFCSKCGQAIDWSKDERNT